MNFKFNKRGGVAAVRQSTLDKLTENENGFITNFFMG